MDAAHARKRRRKRGAALMAVAEGYLPVREAVRDGHSALGTCPIHKLLEAAPGLGPSGVKKILEAAHVWPLAPLGTLDEFQRERILSELPQRVQ